MEYKVGYIRIWGGTWQDWTVGMIYDNNLYVYSFEDNSIRIFTGEASRNCYAENPKGLSIFNDKDEAIKCFRETIELLKERKAIRLEEKQKEFAERQKEFAEKKKKLVEKQKKISEKSARDTDKFLMWFIPLMLAVLITLGIMFALAVEKMMNDPDYLEDFRTPTSRMYR